MAVLDDLNGRQIIVSIGKDSTGEDLLFKDLLMGCFTICLAALASNHEQLIPIIKLSDDSKVKEGQASCYSLYKHIKVLLSINKFHTFCVVS